MLDKIKKIGLFIVLYLLFLFSSLFYLIPLELLNIDYDTLSITNQTLLSLFSSFVMIIILIIIYRKSLKKDFKDFKNNFKEYLDLGLKCWIMGLVIMCACNLLIGLLTPVKEANNEVLVQEMLQTTPLLSFISATFFAPFIEEMLFRKSLGDIYENNYIKIFMCALVFGSLHVIFSMTSAWDLLYILPYGALGGAFAYILTKKNNILIPITFHMLHNGIITIISIIGYLLMVFK